MYFQQVPCIFHILKTVENQTKQQNMDYCELHGHKWASINERLTPIAVS
jgi:hypothetical protein